MDKSSIPNARKERLLAQRNILAPRAIAMVAAAAERVKNTRRMIAQSKTLLGNAHRALESSKLIRRPVRQCIAEAEGVNE